MGQDQQSWGQLLQGSNPTWTQGPGGYQLQSGGVGCLSGGSRASTSRASITRANQQGFNQQAFNPQGMFPPPFSMVYRNCHLVYQGLPQICSNRHIQLSFLHISSILVILQWQITWLFHHLQFSHLRWRWWLRMGERERDQKRKVSRFQNRVLHLMRGSLGVLKLWELIFLKGRKWIGGVPMMNLRKNPKLFIPASNWLSMEGGLGEQYEGWRGVT